ncbi:unnamed protein product [Mytilus edulis]|uniref:Endonuclease/exonuclease/phosphatase domain-containing protein n=1 Tax=Mytilus edulis TaxID=6550 RepID=A0A8S3RQD1_MYTED|nr:unnamed protein product [Mytilus edulis]
MHIISLVETWSDSGKPVDNIPGFDFICNSTRKKHKRARRGSGGISLKIPKSKDNDYSIDSHSLRNNLDSKSANKSGKLLIDLCKESGLRILNGRTIGDPLGKCTCITYNGSSLVDYTLVSSNLLQCIGNFKVSDFTPISDHCPISCSLLTCFQKCKTIETKLDPLRGKFIWDNKAIDCYTTNIQNSHVKQRLDEFVNDKQIDSNSAVEKFNAILCDTALLSTKFVQKKIMNRPIKKIKTMVLRLLS